MRCVTAKAKALTSAGYMNVSGVWADYPELWQELLRLDAKAPYTFLKRYSAADLEEKFALEEARGKLF